MAVEDVEDIFCEICNVIQSRLTGQVKQWMLTAEILH